MKATLLAVSCFLALPLLAQDAPRQRNPRPGVSSVTAQTPGEAETLEKNITIRLHGTTTTGADIDLSLSGIGPRFTADQVVNDDTMLTCQYVVSETENGYRVSYSVGARIKVATNSTNFEYRDVSISGTVLCSADRPQVLVRNGSKPLQLTITKEAEQAAPSNGDKPLTSRRGCAITFGRESEPHFSTSCACL
jgi:hypothetical protein